MTGKNSRMRTLVAPLLAALIWGMAFVAQKMNRMGAFAFNASRSLIACLFLLPVIMLIRRCGVRRALTEKTPKQTKMLWLGGMLCGLTLSLASYFQQHGMDCGTDAGKAGFITALYMILVPVFSLLLGKRCRWTVYLAAGLAVAALYLLCVKEGMGVETSDLFVLCSSFLFCAQILVIDRFAPETDCLKLSFVQFLTSFIVSLAGSVLMGEPFAADMLRESLWPLLYLGVLSSGVAYTLQMIAQQGGNPTVVSILMSMESVFSLLFGFLILKEEILPRQLFGSLLMLCAVLLTQLPEKRTRPEETQEKV